VRLRALAALTVLLAFPLVRADEPTRPAPPVTGATKSDSSGGQPERPIAERFAEIKAEYEASRSTQEDAAYCRRMIELAATSPADPAARDALIWVVNKPYRLDSGEYGEEFGRAAALLVRHHGDDPEAVRIGLTLHHSWTFRRDALLLGFYAAAKGREAKGLARLALAQYLERKAEAVTYARKVEGRPKMRIRGGGKVIREVDLSDEKYAYHLHLRQCDPDVIHAEAERLYEEVISDYGDVPHVTRTDRELELSLKEPTPKTRHGKPLTAEARRKAEQTLARKKKTVGEEAEARLDVMHNLVAGKPAPEITGVDVDGKPLKLSDFKGKVVMLVFWGSWCGPCMAQIPHERELVERLKGRPFALLGVNCGDDKETARKVIERERMAWPNWFDGALGEGPIADRYHIRGYPSVFVLDAEGIIRDRTGLDKDVDKLLEEVQTPASEQNTSRPDIEKSETSGV
jgi:thiol-disulfide isomerase/thioredoxin